ncbi:MAG: DUF1566 domain-containing protein [Candidatus Contendobacter sp.]|nr:DUF1566 domain-containing protein [Candidatus Contendobacter sp.]MDS4058649.1 DUF1566 domain-containing protein [Candidatus Contendobacter sp.]
MRSGWSWIEWGIVLGLMGSPVWGAEPDPEAVRRWAEKYEREAAEEAAKKAPAPKPQPKPAPAPKPQPKPAPTVDHDREAWQSVEKCGTAACFRAYLENYPKGRYAKMARARLESETESRPPAAERPKLPSRPDQRLLADRYRDNGDGTVTDVQTGLQWMRCPLGQTWRGGTCIGKDKQYAWQAALDAAEALNRQGGYAGYRDWRVPAIEELRTLVYCSSGQPKTWNDTGKSCEGGYEGPTIYRPAFPNMPSMWLWYWSASPYAPRAGYALNVNFDSGNDGAGRGISAVRLVRGGQ